jgi:hypothetical protein
VEPDASELELEETMPGQPLEQHQLIDPSGFTRPDENQARPRRRLGSRASLSVDALKYLDYLSTVCVVPCVNDLFC